MKPLLVATALIVSVAVAAPAAAGGYIAAGLGSDAVLTRDLDERFDAEATGSGRLALGARFGPVALEANAFGAAFAGLSMLRREATAPGNFTPISLGADLKYHLSFLPLVELYGRAGLNRTWALSSGEMFPERYSGTGHALGGGLQLPFRALPIVQAGVWLDYTRHSTRLTSASGDEVAGDAHMVMLGLSVGTGL